MTISQPANASAQVAFRATQVEPRFPYHHDRRHRLKGGALTRRQPAKSRRNPARLAQPLDRRKTRREALPLQSYCRTSRSLMDQCLVKGTTLTRTISLFLLIWNTSIASLVVLISDPPLTKIRSNFVCISLCRERKSLVRIGDSLGIELYFAFRDKVAIAATAAA
jgi:hypothetical protein